MHWKRASSLEKLNGSGLRMKKIFPEKYKINVSFFLMQIRVNASETSETICSLFFDEKEKINRDFSGQNKDHPSRLQFQADYYNNSESDSFDWHLEKKIWKGCRLCGLLCYLCAKEIVISKYYYHPTNRG